MDQFFRIGIDVDGASMPFQTLYPSEQVRHVVDVLAAEVFEQLAGFRIELLGQKKPQRRLIAVLNVNADRLALVLTFQLRGRETPVELRKHVQDVFTGPERVRAEVRTGAIGVPWLVAAHRDAVRLAGNRAADGVIGPRLVRIRRLDGHPLSARPLPPLLYSAFDKFLFAQALDRHPLGWGRRKTQRHFLVENECKSGPDMLAQ